MTGTNHVKEMAKIVEDIIKPTGEELDAAMAMIKNVYKYGVHVTKMYIDESGIPVTADVTREWVEMRGGLP